MAYTIDAHWCSYGFECCAVMHEMGHYCGYALIPETHPFCGIAYDETAPVVVVNDRETDIDRVGILPFFAAAFGGDEEAMNDLQFQLGVHGGVTYTDWGDWKHIQGGENVTEGWWIGWDCSHSGDAPHPSPSGMHDYMVRDGHVWTLDEVIAETEQLCEQLQSIAAIRRDQEAVYLGVGSRVGLSDRRAPRKKRSIDEIVNEMADAASVLQEHFVAEEED